MTGRAILRPAVVQSINTLRASANPSAQREPPFLPACNTPSFERFEALSYQVPCSSKTLHESRAATQMLLASSFNTASALLPG